MGRRPSFELPHSKLERRFFQMLETIFSDDAAGKYYIKIGFTRHTIDQKLLKFVIKGILKGKTYRNKANCSQMHFQSRAKNDFKAEIT